VIQPVTEPSHAVFLSYASQDVEAAEKICEALRVAGIEVWFDQSELRGGDAWDQSIRKQIKACALFLPVISHTTHDRVEGYFRLEWKLGIDRSHLISADQTFLLPVVIDDTRDDDERVPERFREVQWTRLPGGVTPATFVERVRRLLSGELSLEPTRTASAPARVPAAPSTRKPVLASWRSKTAVLATFAVVIAALGYLVANRLVLSKRGAEVAPATTFSPPPHSIAVLPFVNLSGDKEQEYFSDGLTEELLNSLAEINELQVAARTSAFSFKGKDNDIGMIARKLNVGTVLEGSVRRSEHTIRITAQLINAVTGFHLWSKTYDRDLGDVLKLQTEIATAVSEALKVTLLGDVAAKIELGGTHNPAAFDAYLRASRAYASRHEAKAVPTAIAAYTEAVDLDPNYALAFAGRSRAFATYAAEVAEGAEVRESFINAEADAKRAIELAPDLAAGHMALARVFQIGTLDFARAREEYERAQVLAPGNATVLSASAGFAAIMGHSGAGIAALRRAVVLDPLSSSPYGALGEALYAARRYREAATVFSQGIIVDPNFKLTYAFRGLALYGLGDLEKARASCESQRDDWLSQVCLAVVYNKLGRRADAEAVLAKLKAAQGDDAAYQYAQIYAQWGARPKALEWLDKAMSVRDPGLEFLKADPLFDPLRKEPRFQAIEQELKFPS
jgi:TolB-like protein/tetratricopeptide (TPR) repeat protein